MSYYLQGFGTLPEFIPSDTPNSPTTTCPRNYIPNGKGGCQVVCKAGYHPDSVGKYCYPDQATQPSAPVPVDFPTITPPGCPPGAVDVPGYGCVVVSPQTGQPVPQSACPAGQMLDPLTGQFCIPTSAAAPGPSAGWWPSNSMPGPAPQPCPPGAVWNGTACVVATGLPPVPQPPPPQIQPSPASVSPGILERPIFWVAVLAVGLVALTTVAKR